jgi:hypothetical protein
MPEIDPPDVIHDVEVHVVDVAAPYAEMPPEVHRAAFGKDYTGPKWRFVITFHGKAIADDVAYYVVNVLPTRGV